MRERVSGQWIPAQILDLGSCEPFGSIHVQCQVFIDQRERFGGHESAFRARIQRDESVQTEGGQTDGAALTNAVGHPPLSGVHVVPGVQHIRTRVVDPDLIADHERRGRIDSGVLPSSVRSKRQPRVSLRGSPPDQSVVAVDQFRVAVAALWGFVVHVQRPDVDPLVLARRDAVELRTRRLIHVRCEDHAGDRPVDVIVAEADADGSEVRLCLLWNPAVADVTSAVFVPHRRPERIPESYHPVRIEIMLPVRLVRVWRPMDPIRGERGERAYEAGRQPLPAKATQSLAVGQFPAFELGREFRVRLSDREIPVHRLVPSGRIRLPGVPEHVDVGRLILARDHDVVRGGSPIRHRVQLRLLPIDPILGDRVQDDVRMRIVLGVPVIPHLEELLLRVIEDRALVGIDEPVLPRPVAHDQGIVRMPLGFCDRPGDAPGLFHHHIVQKEDRGPLEVHRDASLSYFRFSIADFRLPDHRSKTENLKSIIA